MGDGTYYHRSLALDGLSGSAASPIRIQAEPRGLATVSAAWREAAEGRAGLWTAEGGGIYSAPNDTPAIFGGWQGTLLFRYETLADLQNAETTPVPTQYSGDVFGPVHGFAWEDERIYLRLPGEADPEGEPLVFSTPTWDEGTVGSGAQPVIAVSGTPGLIFDGLRIVGSGTYGVTCDEGSPDVVFRNCLFEYCRSAVQISGG
ncbi:MAG: hypothetical protein CMJ84_16590 [Planctomycetes bacterium]|nr:hypothetical protein [Planctomycetota bacterium]MDP6409938.1 hypothetical protein [Planctomycetota bacterium]